jgi:lysozyme family protein
MNPIDELRREIRAERETLGRRFRTTGDAAEKEQIRQVIEALSDQLAELNQAALLQAATSLTVVTAELERAVAAARLGPFDGYLAALEGHFERLGEISARMHGSESLPAAPEFSVRARSRSAKRSRAKPRGKAAATRRRKARRVEAPADEPVSFDIGAAPAAPLNSKKFVDLSQEYQRFFDQCAPRDQFMPHVSFHVKRIRQGKPTYELVQAATGVPWMFVGIVHGMEAGFNFSSHLHNGDPLTARTVQVPKGRPLNGAPPFTWLDSAIDALRFEKLHLVSDWSVPHMLFLLEGYNGFGYRARGVPSPYLWSFSNIYDKGKFVADGKFDPNAVSKQCGSALMLKAIVSNA